MDDATLSAYDRDAKVFADDWDAQPPPIDLHAVVGQFFIRGPTADVGCGSGRDAAWLSARGFPTTAFDPERVLRALKATQLLLDEQVGSLSSGKLIRRIVVRKQSTENEAHFQNSFTKVSLI